MNSESLNRLRLRNEEGFNLIEMLIATAILGTVLLSIMSLFFLGQRNVYSGKQTTRAVSVSTRILEDLEPMTADQIVDSFYLASVVPTGPITVGGQSYSLSATRDTATINAGTTDKNGYLATWNALLTQTSFLNGKVTLVFTPADPTDSSTTAKKWATAQYLRIAVVAEWNEAGHRRAITMKTAKTTRP